MTPTDCAAVTRATFAAISEPGQGEAFASSARPRSLFPFGRQREIAGQRPSSVQRSKNALAELAKSALSPWVFAASIPVAAASSSGSVMASR